jgi:hypothetical protein
MCGMFGQAPRPDDCLASYKPAPAADDLVVNLRAAHGGQYVDDANMCGKAADRIEALKARVARLTATIENRPRVAEHMTAKHFVESYYNWEGHAHTALAEANDAG